MPKFKPGDIIAGPSLSGILILELHFNTGKYIGVWLKSHSRLALSFATIDEIFNYVNLA